MEFLNKKEKRWRTIRLFTGYVLIGIAVALGTVILVYEASGYDINPTTRTIFQNGLIFINSRPDGATVFVGGKQERSKTDTRLVLPGGVNHTIVLKKTGYRDWTKTLLLDGGVIEYLQYIRLVPEVLTPQDYATFSVPPAIASFSPDRRWLLLAPTLNDPGALLYDLSDDKPTAQPISVPLLQDTTDPITRVAVKEWSYDNKALLINTVRASGKTTYVWLSRENPANSVDLSELYGFTVHSAVFKGRRNDQLFVQSATGEVFGADARNRSLTTAFAAQVRSFVSTTDEVLAYVATPGSDNLQRIMLAAVPERQFELTTLPRDHQIMLTANRYKDVSWLAVSAVNDNQVQLFKDPFNALRVRNEEQRKVTLRPDLRLRMNEGVAAVKYSDIGRFVGMQAGDGFMIYDLETNRSTRFVTPPATSLSWGWYDDAHLSIANGQNEQICDFDYTNCYDFGSRAFSLPASADRREAAYYSFKALPTSTVLTRTALTVD